MDVVVASTEADLRAVEAITNHHAEMAGTLAAKAAAVRRAAAAGADPVTERDDLVDWAHQVLVPHALAEESGIYATAAALPEGRLLVEALVAEHGVIKGLVSDLASATGVDAAGLATALETLFRVHADKENEQVLPLLAAAPSVSLAELLDGMHAELGGHEHGHAHAHGQAESGCGGQCTCGEKDTGDDVELDARAVPHAIRHATIFGALDGLRAGTALVLVAPHDPLPLLAQVEQRDPGAFEVSYLERGPEAWRLRFRRRAAA